jgi:hypothetical protein
MRVHGLCASFVGTGYLGRDECAMSPGVRHCTPYLSLVSAALGVNN